MTITVKAKVTNGAIVPLEPVDLEEGAEVLVSIADRPASTTADSVLELFDRMHRSATAETWANMPADGSKNVAHYLYGWPKAVE